MGCEADGMTSRSLSLVSRQVRERSKSFRFLSITVRSARGIISLSERLQATIPSQRHIRHLHICYDGRVTTRQQFTPSGIVRRLSSLVIRRDYSHDMPEDEQVCISINRILQYAVPMVRTLVVQHTSTRTHMPAVYHPDECFHLYGPSIETLKLELGRCVWYRWILPPNTKPLSSLRVLDLGNGYYTARIFSPYSFYQSISILAPHLTHLRLHLRDTINLRRGLGHSVRTPDPSDKLPDSIVCVIIQLEYVFDCSSRCGDLSVRERCPNCRFRLLLMGARALEDIDERVILQATDESAVEVEDFVRQKTLSR